jgi:hypothetical protein
MQAAVAELEQRGYSIVPQLVTPKEAATISRALDRIALRSAGTRNLLNLPWCHALVQRIRERLTNASALKSYYVAVQCTLFDKTPSRNWLVALHQDLSIPVAARLDNPQLGAWSKKEGGHFVQPPSEVLENLLAVRVHVDDCGPQSGPLRVVPASHKLGRLSGPDAAKLRAKLSERPCLAKRGDAILMRPLLLHASSKAVAPSRRRVLHVLFGPRALPYGLEWKHAV